MTYWLVGLVSALLIVLGFVKARRGESWLPWVAAGLVLTLLGSIIETVP